MIKEELGIAELAKYVGIQSQSIYVRLRDKNNKLQSYVVPNKTPTHIRKEAIAEVFGKDIESLERGTIQHTIQHTRTATEENEAEFLRFKIKTLETMLADKDKQIADKDDYILKQQKQIDQKGEEVQQLITLLSQEQALNLQKKEYIEKLEMKALPSADDNKREWSIFSIFKKRIKE